MIKCVQYFVYMYKIWESWTRISKSENMLYSGFIQMCLIDVQITEYHTSYHYKNYSCHNFSLILYMFV